VNRIITAGSLLVLMGAAHAIAQTCPGTNQLSPAQIEQVVGGRYACANLSASEKWDELHTGSISSSTGQVLDYKLGPISQTDPSDTSAHPTGAYSVTGDGNSSHPGTITYTYGSNTFGYKVNDASGSYPNAGTYSFCTTGAGLNILVTIAASHCY
jgi:hypothetical protein